VRNGRGSLNGEQDMHEALLLIAGRNQAASGDRWCEWRDPVSAAVATRAAAATADDAHAAADAAAAAFPAWAETGPGQRRSLLQKAADLLEARSGDFIARMCAETGATAGWGGFNAMLAAGMLREAAAITTQIDGQVIP
jgi:acyl-CoA reductase-like NAD-dependent aldehyde dehydrogenase